MPSRTPMPEELDKELRKTLEIALAAADSLMNHPDKTFYARHLAFWAGHVTTDSAYLITAVMAEDKAEEQVHA